MVMRVSDKMLNNNKIMACYCISERSDTISQAEGTGASCAPQLHERKRVMRVLTAGMVAMMMTAGVAAAKPALKDVAEIDDKMLQVGIALEISEKCGAISARKLKGVNFLWQLKRRANALGYSDDEIDAYRKSKANKARIRAEGEAYVKSKGLNPKSAADLCKLGRAEIASGSVIGGLLKAK